MKVDRVIGTAFTFLSWLDPVLIYILVLLLAWAALACQPCLLQCCIFSVDRFYINSRERNCFKQKGNLFDSFAKKF